MTIIVYDKESNRVLVDSLHQVSGSFKPVNVTMTKIHVTEHGHKYASAGTCDDFMMGFAIDEAITSLTQSKLPLLEYNPDEVSIFVRTIDGRVLCGEKHGDKTLLSVWPYSFPCSRGAGGVFFDAFYLEHRNVDKAMVLTCEHAFGCGLPIDVF